MVKRYADKVISDIWTDERKVQLWQLTELAVIKAREEAGLVPANTGKLIREALEAHPCDLEWWKEREKVLSHDLNAWLEERMRFIPSALQQYFHQGLTSYDTEESGFVLRLSASTNHIMGLDERVLEALRVLAVKYRYVPMNERTHGQEAELKSFGARCLSWYQELLPAKEVLTLVSSYALQFSKLSGAVGTYSGLSPALEEAALAILGLKPYYGATQIMPRALYSPLAGALADMATALEKIAIDIRLGSRSGRPLWHEPFGKKQKGSSAMPHKKNNIGAEKVSGLARVARAHANVIRENILTWEARAIEQSSAERISWPDLFHVVAHALTTMEKILSGLVVYPDNMMREIVASCGTHVSNEAKEFLTTHGVGVGIAREDAYRIVQLAAFNAFAPDEQSKYWRENRPDQGVRADTMFSSMERGGGMQRPSICLTIEQGNLIPSPELDITEAKILEWNNALVDLFKSPEIHKAWRLLFRPSRCIEREKILFEKILRKD